MTETDIERELFALGDEGYRAFHTKLIPTIDPDTVIGVRIPLLRKFSAKVYASGAWASFMERLPHKYYEENNLHAFLIERLRDYEKTLAATERFLPYVDNWATCDSFNPKVFRERADDMLPHIFRWLACDRPYTVRFAIGLLMRNYLGGNFKPEYAAAVAAVSSDEYYVNMMRAWYFAEALVKQYDCAMSYITGAKLDKQTRNKSIQKAIESKRVPDAVKALLRRRSK